MVRYREDIELNDRGNPVFDISVIILHTYLYSLYIMISKYRATVVKHSYAVNKTEFITLLLVELPYYFISRSWATQQPMMKTLLNVLLSSKRNKFKITIFSNDKRFADIKYRYEHEMPIIIKGEYNIINLPFEYHPKGIDVTTYDLETNKYVRKPLIMSTTNVFIDQRDISLKDKIINKKIDNLNKYKIVK
jgi:hypothetical protein